jgi:hypothetical protein
MTLRVANSWQSFPAGAVEKNLQAAKIIPDSSIFFSFYDAVGLQKKNYIFFIGVEKWFISCFYFLARIKENKRRKTNFQKLGPFSAIPVQNRPKISRSFIGPFQFLTGPGGVMWPNNRRVGHIGMSPFKICTTCTLYPYIPVWGWQRLRLKIWVQ